MAIPIQISSNRCNISAIVARRLVRSVIIARRPRVRIATIVPAAVITRARALRRVRSSLQYTPKQLAAAAVLRHRRPGLVLSVDKNAQTMPLQQCDGALYFPASAAAR